MNENNLDLSVCMVTWNANDLTMACLRSLVQHTKAINYEIILVDNGSIDETVKNVKNIFPQVRLIVNTTDTGYTYANNQALAVVKGRYSVLLNNDMLFESNALSKMVAFMDNNSDVGVLGCRLRLGNGNIQPSANGVVRWQDYLFSALFLNRIFPSSKAFGHINSTYIDYEKNDLAIDTGWVVGAALMVRTDSLSKVGFLDKKMVGGGEDWEWCRRYAQQGYRIVYYTGAEIIHFHGLSTINYVGIDRDNIRYDSIMKAIAATQYVYRKMHKGAITKIALFNTMFRLHCFSRSIAYWLRNIVVPKSADYGSCKAYFIGAFTTYGALQKCYLRADQ